MTKVILASKVQQVRVMIKTLNILLFDNQKWIPLLNNKAKKLHLCKDLKSLVRSLIEKEVDLIIYENGQIEASKIQKIFKTYKIPFLQVGGAVDNKLEGVLLSPSEDLISEIDIHSDLIKSYEMARSNNEYNFILEGIRDFDINVLNVGKDLFIAETKTYFKKIFRAGNSTWVDVPKTSSKLPPILKLKQELSQQKVDHSGLISDLDDCIQEIVSEDTFQVWRHKQGKYLALLWLDVGDDKSQCLLINGLQFSTKRQVQSLFYYLVPTLNRRWNLCLAMSEAQEQVYKDSLTNLYNQKYLTETLDKKIEEYKRYKTPFSVLFIDVDYFKQVNDTDGHVVGSGVLCQMGTLIEGQIRSSDYAFRYGGDEFIILLSHTEGDDAVKVAERIRARVEASTFNVNNIGVNITVSIGLAFYPEHAQSAEEIIRIADEAMYYGKKKSRNIVYKAS
ncbi:MAG: GGDEF domain-containing protein [Bdellovibrionales bacterium]|nr:GGDEF domain-containing protein [Bdellovibrionales bacterium]